MIQVAHDLSGSNLNFRQIVPSSLCLYSAKYVVGNPNPTESIPVGNKFPEFAEHPTYPPKFSVHVYYHF